jgi:putative aldouronate transport system substrate-binding protein
MKTLRKMLFVCVILAVLLAGCGQATPQVSVPPEGETGGETAGSGEPITLEVFVDTEGEDAAIVKDSKLTKFMEERFNVNFDVVSGTTGDTLTLMLASGDYPKLIYKSWFSMLDVVKYGELGVFLPLEDWIDEHAPNVKKAINESPGLKAAVYAPDGHIYMMPYWEECYHCGIAMKMWINTDWLEAVGMEMPTTTEEFEQVLIAFRDQDPNGNGKKDEIPLTGRPGGWNNEPWDFLMNAFIYDTGAGSDYVYIEGDQVTFAPNKPEWQEGLRYAKSLYDQGLYDPQSFTMGEEQFRTLLNDEEELVGVYAAGHLGMGVDPWASEEMLARAAKYEPLPPLKGPAGVQQTPYWPTRGMDGSFAVTNKASEEEAIAFIKLLDWHYSEEGAISAWYGPPEVGWVWAEEGDLGIDGNKAIWKPVESQSAEFLSDLSWEPIFYMPARLFLGWRSDQDVYTTDGYERRLYLATKLYEPYAPEKIPPGGMYMTSEDSDTYAQLVVPIQSHVYLNSVAFIIGEKDIDTEWSSYVAGFDGMQLDTYLATLQKYYKP